MKCLFGITNRIIFNNRVKKMSEQTIEWKTIEGHPNYSVSSVGDVRNDKTGLIIKPIKLKRGYRQVHFYKNREYKNLYIHRLVAIHFIPNPENKRCVDHIDGDPSNNNITNLRWATSRENGANSKMQSNNSSGVTGVSWSKQQSKWTVQIRINGIKTNLGNYSTIEEATEVRRAAAQEHFGEFAHISEK